MQAISELFEIDLGTGTTYYFWTVIGDEHIEDTVIQLYDLCPSRGSNSKNEHCMYRNGVSAATRPAPGVDCNHYDDHQISVIIMHDGSYRIGGGECINIPRVRDVLDQYGNALDRRRYVCLLSTCILT
jgi:hypothetical protein